MRLGERIKRALQGNPSEGAGKAVLMGLSDDDSLSLRTDVLAINATPKTVQTIYKYAPRAVVKILKHDPTRATEITRNLPALERHNVTLVHHLVHLLPGETARDVITAAIRRTMPGCPTILTSPSWPPGATRRTRRRIEEATQIRPIEQRPLIRGKLLGGTVHSLRIPHQRSEG